MTRSGHRTLHLLPAERWAAWRDGPADTRYEPEAFEAYGFIHCTDDAADLLDVADRFYADETRPLVVLELELVLAGAPWRYDDAERRYPHVYGSLSRACVLGVAAVERDAFGRFVAIGPMTPVRTA